MCVYIYVYMYTCIDIDIYTYMFKYIYIYIHSFYFTVPPSVLQYLILSDCIVFCLPVSHLVVLYFI